MNRSAPLARLATGKVFWPEPLHTLVPSRPRFSNSISTVIEPSTGVKNIVSPPAEVASAPTSSFFFQTSSPVTRVTSRAGPSSPVSVDVNFPLILTSQPHLSSPLNDPPMASIQSWPSRISAGCEMEGGAGGMSNISGSRPRSPLNAVPPKLLPPLSSLRWPRKCSAEPLARLNCLQSVGASLPTNERKAGAVIQLDAEPSRFLAMLLWHSRQPPAIDPEQRAARGIAPPPCSTVDAGASESSGSDPTPSMWGFTPPWQLKQRGSLVTNSAIGANLWMESICFASDSGHDVPPSAATGDDA